MIYLRPFTRNTDGKFIGLGIEIGDSVYYFVIINEYKEKKPYFHILSLHIDYRDFKGIQICILGIGLGLFKRALNM